MPTDLRDKLRRLGVHKGALALLPPQNREVRRGDLESLVQGRLVDTPYGPAFLHEETYPADYLHGRHTLGELLRLSPSIAAQLGNDPGLEKVDLQRVVFLDTETTGLAGGTGTLVFLVGLGAFQTLTLNSNSNSNFHIHQFFLRSPAEEPAMLHALAEWLDSFDAIVSFNGRGFDLPLLESRFQLARMRPRILRAPHLDLLLPARRVWRGRLASCRLKTLEQHILDIRREQADVEGWEIPGLYQDYLRSGDAGEMPRVIYHNRIDILSMVALSARLIALLASHAEGLRDAGDWLALGKWHADLGRMADAESALLSCLAAQPDPATRSAALHQLGGLLKRSNRRDEAARVWEALSDSKTWQGVEACVELAKRCEWREVNLDRAVAWTREAIAIARVLPDADARARLDAELLHRMERLERKRQNL